MVSGVIEPFDIKLYLTGGSSNANPNLSLGGNVSSVEITSEVMNNLFRRVTDQEASNGVSIYRCIAIKNKDGTALMRNVVFYMVKDTLSVDDFCVYSIGQNGKNATETTLVDEFTTPTGSNIDFIGAVQRTNGLKLGNLSPNDFRCVWIADVVNPGAKNFPDNQVKFRIEVNPTTTSENPVPTPPPDPDTGTVSNFTMATLGDMSCNSDFKDNFNSIKGRNTGFVMFNGDNAYSSGSSCWVSIVQGIKDHSGTSFGNHDVDESESQPSTKNALLNLYGYSKTYNKKIFKNVGMITMESGENQSVSDSVGSTQYNFIKDTLKDWDENHPEIEWIMVFNHYPLYGPSSDHANNGGGRDRYDPLFDQYGVDVVTTSHNHISWQTKLLKYNSGSPSNPTTSGTDPNYSYSKSASNHGKIYLGSGSGGRALDSASTNSYVIWVNDNDFGYWFFDFQNNGKKLVGKWYTNGNSLKKTFSITHTA